MPTFTHAHASGLWDAPTRAWDDLTHDLSGQASVVAFTETTRYKPTGNRKGWQAYHGERKSGANECTICWDSNEWTALPRAFTRPVSRTKYALGNGRIRPDVHVTVVVLRHWTGQLFAFGVFHAPSAIEGRRSLIAGVRRAQAFMECLAGWRKIRRELRREHPGILFVLSADWNLNLKLAWVRAFLAANVGMRNAWRKLPARGSHGDRLIDGVRHSRRLQARSRLLARRPRFDHTPVLTEFDYKEK